jgi:hypothetical protein
MVPPSSRPLKKAEKRQTFEKYSNCWVSCRSVEAQGHQPRRVNIVDFGRPILEAARLS